MASAMMTTASAGMQGTEKSFSESLADLTTHWTLQPTSDHSQFPPMPEFLRFSVAIFLFIVFFVGCAGNIAVIWIFSQTRSLRSPPNVLIVNLACSDLAMVLFEFPMMLVAIVHGRWKVGDIGCDVYAFGGAMFGVLSISTLTAIAFDRQYAICSSLDKLSNITYGRAFRMVIFVWIYSLFWAILPLFGIGAYVLEGYGVSCTFEYLDESRANQIFVGFLFCADFVLPLTAIILCYINIVNTVRKNRKNLQDIAKDDSVRKDSKKNKQKNSEFAIAKIGMTLTTLFVLSWTPYAVVAFIGEYINPDLLSPMVQTLPAVFAKSSAVWNPIVYAISHKKFKQALRDHFLKKCCGGVISDRGISSAEYTLRESKTASVRTSRSHDQRSKIKDTGSNRETVQVRLSSPGQSPEQDAGIYRSSSQLCISDQFQERQGISNNIEMQDVNL